MEVMDGSVFIVSQPDYDNENIDSVWTDEGAAVSRAAELGTAFISEYRANQIAAWVRNGWAPANDPPLWSDWGGTGPSAELERRKNLTN